MKLKKLLSVIIVGASLGLSLVACSGNAASTDDNIGTENLQPASPFEPCKTLAEAEKIAGFELELPRTADSMEVIRDEMIQAFYGTNGTDMLIRKGVGSVDISGDYNEYTQVESVDGVTLKGKGNRFSLALWTDNGYTYSVFVGNALPQSDIMELVSNVK